MTCIFDSARARSTLVITTATFPAAPTASTIVTATDLLEFHERRRAGELAVSLLELFDRLLASASEQGRRKPSITRWFKARSPTTIANGAPPIAIDATVISISSISDERAGLVGRITCSLLVMACVVFFLVSAPSPLPLGIYAATFVARLKGFRKVERVFAPWRGSFSLCLCDHAPGPCRVDRTGSCAIFRTVSPAK